MYLVGQTKEGQLSAYIRRTYIRITIILGMYASDVSKGIFAISFVPTAYSYKKYTSTRKKYLYDDCDDLKYLTIKSSGSGMCRSDIYLSIPAADETTFHPSWTWSVDV